MKYYDEMGRNYRIDGPFFAASTCDVVEFPKVYPTNFASTQFTFDYFGRALTQDRLDETYAHIITSRSYTGATTGLTTMITDPDDRIRDEITDHLGRLHEVVEHVENDVLQHTYYDYNSAGKLVEIVDNAGNTTTISYDVMGRQTGMSDPAMGLWSYTYDSNSNLLTQIDGKNQTTTFGYDELNRLTTKTYSTSDTNSVIYTYDKAGVTNGVGRLGSIDNTSTKSGAKPGVVIAYNEYDAMGRVKSVSKSIAGNPFSNTLYEHDLSGKTTKLTYPDGYALKNTFYPGTNLLHTVEGAADAKTYATVSGYEPGGRIGRLEFGNKLVTTFDYDYGTGRLYETKTQNPLTQANVQWRNYTYTAAGDIWSVKNTLANNEYQYDYDYLHRLRGEVSADTTALNREVSVASTFGTSFPIHAPKSVTVGGASYNYAYDGNGNMTSGSDYASPGSVVNRSITYNAENMPVSVTRGSALPVEFVYDGQNVRARKSTLTGETYYYNELFEVTNSAPVKYVFAGNLRIAKLDVNGAYYFHKDHLGSSTTVTNETGAVVETAENLPFGGERSHSGSYIAKYGFTDQEHDVETGLHNFKSRLYDPAAGRFVTPDPYMSPNLGSAVSGVVARYMGTGAADMSSYFSDPQRLNRYAYVKNNPLKYVDPWGLKVYIVINRDTYSNRSITGTISVISDRVDNNFSGYTIEAAQAGFNRDKNPIPSGTYDAFERTYTDPNRPHRIELEHFDNYDNIQIHIANSPDKIFGCFGVGTSRSEDWVSGSTNAMNSILNIVNADGSSDIEVQVIGSNTDPDIGGTCEWGGDGGGSDDSTGDNSGDE